MALSARKNIVNSIVEMSISVIIFLLFICRIYLKTVVGYILSRPVHYTQSRENILLISTTDFN